MGKSIFNSLNLILQKRIAKILFRSAGVIGVLALASSLMLPSYVKQIAVKQVDQKLGRQLQIGSVRFSPFQLALTLSDVTLLDVDRKAPDLHVDHLTVNLSISSIWHRALVLDAVDINGLRLNVARYSAGEFSRYNFSDLLDRIAAQPKSDTPFRFAVGNLQVHRSTIQFDDKVVSKRTTVENLDIGVPFLSNFPTDVESDVLPHISAKINGAAFSLKGRSKPFKDSLDTSLAIDLEQFDIPNLLAYSPLPLPVVVQSAKLSTQLDLVFSRQHQQSNVLLAGDIKLDQLLVNDLHSSPLLQTQQMATHLDQVKLLTGDAKIKEIAISNPEVWIAIDQKGRINWPPVATFDAKPQSELDLKKKNEGTPPSILIQSFQISKGAVHLSDAAHASPKGSIEIGNITAAIKQLSNAIDAKPATFQLSFEGQEKESVAIEGDYQLANSVARSKVHIQGVTLENYQAFISPVLAANVHGVLGVDAEVALENGQVALSNAALQLNQFQLSAKQKELGGITMEQLDLTQIQLDSLSRQLTLGGVAMKGLKADIRRAENGMWGLQQLIVKQSPVSNDVNAKPQPSTWRMLVKEFGVTHSGFQLQDQSTIPAVDLDVHDVEFNLSQWTNDFSQPIKLSLQAAIQRRGDLKLRADLSANLAAMHIDVNANNLPIARVSPYFAQHLNVTMTRGNANVNGKLDAIDVLRAAPKWNFDGAISLNEFHVLENGTSEDFLTWKSIALDGIHANFNSDQSLVHLKTLSLNDFFARVLLSEKGNLNLQNIVAKNVSSSDSSESSASDASKNNLTDKPVDSSAEVSKPASTNAHPLVIRIDQTFLRGGNVNFTDHFIKPNYVANLTGLNGRIGALASDNFKAANIELNGKVDDEAPLTISGTLNPLAKPIFLDVKGSATGIELTRLTPYAAKYAGYAIEKGRLSVGVSYHVENQELQAQNDIQLDQLTFGDRVESPDATHLPVMLAVALLRDNDGKIAINLPISGSISDPEFSVGGIIFKVLGNVITKAVTSPFSLLSSAFGGGDELGYAEFAPGDTILTPSTMSKLDSLATALNHRPSLRMDIIGRVDPVADVEGLRRQNLYKKMQQLKWRELTRQSGQQNRRPKVEEVTIDANERLKYLDAVYSAEKFSKPRNLIGIAKTLSPEEQERLILQNTVISEDALRYLAERRADAVRDYLEEQGKVSKDKIFLVAPKLNADGIEDKGVASRVDFSLR